MARSLVCSLITAAVLASGPAQGEEPLGRHGVVVDLPLVDVPFNLLGGLTSPSMGQSLGLSASFYQMLHGGLGWVLDPYEGAWWQQLGGRALIGAADLLVTNLPLGLAWQHEEGHRAVLSRERIKSFNGVYRFEPFAEVVAVSEVADGDLAAFKARSPGGFVRMSTAGLEVNLELVTSLSKTQLFYKTRAWHGFLFWQVYLTNTLYQATCANADGDRITEEEEQREGINIAARDFTGLDCNAWAYDLFRPTEAYEARGVHPSGVGVRRYRKRSDLTVEERSYLKQQLALSFLNFLDPTLIGWDWFTVEVGEGRRPLRWNGRVRHMAAPFGQTIHLEAYGQYQDYHVALGLLGGMNREQFFPGVNAELHRFPLDLVIGKPVTVSARASLWLQPRNQRFQDAHYQPGVLGNLRLAYAFSTAFEPYVEVEGKSPGWVPGNVWLEANLSARAGVVSTLLD
ncbi:MAG: hypothetical protein RMJ98_22090 [Myxococcales bacterium]|nr:hypothetical protein [Polyangiaceae bacterium]MDW8251997.1 hypothetical protein [Myxococcales bacterium]